MTFYISVEAPHVWADMDRRGHVLDQGTSDSLDFLSDHSGVTVVGVVPGQDVVLKEVSLPAVRRQKLLAAIPYALEESLTADIDTLHFALLDSGPEEGSIVAVVSRERLESWIAVFRDAGIELDGLIPDFLLVPIHPQVQITVARTSTGQVCIRGPGSQAMNLDASALGIWWDELPDKSVAVAVNDKDIAQRLADSDGALVSEWNIGETFASWLTHQEADGNADRYNLLQDAYRVRDDQRYKPFKIAMVAGALALLLVVVSNVVEYGWLKREHDRLETEIQALFRETFPSITRVVNPRVQMEQEIQALKSGGVSSGEFQFLLSAVAQTVPNVRATVEEINYRDNEMLIICNTDDFAGLDRLTKGFQAVAGVNVQLLSSGSRDNRVTGRFSLQREGV